MPRDTHLLASVIHFSDTEPLPSSPICSLTPLSSLGHLDPSSGGEAPRASPGTYVGISEACGLENWALSSGAHTIRPSSNYPAGYRSTSLSRFSSGLRQVGESSKLKAPPPKLSPVASHAGPASLVHLVRSKDVDVGYKSDFLKMLLNVGASLCLCPLWWLFSLYDHNNWEIVCGVFTVSSRYLSRPHQRSFTEQNYVLSSYLAKLLCDFFFKRLRFLSCHLWEATMWVWQECVGFFVNMCKKTVGRFEHAWSAVQCVFTLVYFGVYL